MSAKSAERFRSLLYALPDAVVLTSSEGRIEFANAAAERTFGYARPELEGRSISVLLGGSAAVETLYSGNQVLVSKILA